MKEAVVTTRKEVGWKILLGDQHSSRDNWLGKEGRRGERGWRQEEDRKRKPVGQICDGGWAFLYKVLPPPPGATWYLLLTITTTSTTPTYYLPPPEQPVGTLIEDMKEPHKHWHKQPKHDDDDDYTQWWNSVKEDRLLRPGPGPDQVRPVAVGVLASIQIPCWYITNTMHI